MYPTCLGGRRLALSLSYSTVGRLRTAASQNDGTRKLLIQRESSLTFAFMATNDCEAGAPALFVTSITMSSTNFDVEYVAELARIKLTPVEIKTLQAQVGDVLEHEENLNAVDVSQVEPMAHSFQIYNVFREDEPRDGLDREIALSNAPRQAQGLFIVTKVVE